MVDNFFVLRKTVLHRQKGFTFCIKEKYRTRMLLYVNAIKFIISDGGIIFSITCAIKHNGC